jgi:hypothetical protein
MHRPGIGNSLLRVGYPDGAANGWVVACANSAPIGAESSRMFDPAQWF